MKEIKVKQYYEVFENLNITYSLLCQRHIILNEERNEREHLTLLQVLNLFLPLHLISVKRCIFLQLLKVHQREK